jgi:hypothetical protein
MKYGLVHGDITEGYENSIKHVCVSENVLETHSIDYGPMNFFVHILQVEAENFRSR